MYPGIEERVAACLPKSGGTMTGSIKKNGGTIIENENGSTRYISIDGLGASIQLYPKTHETSPSQLNLGVRNTADTSNIWLVLKHDGTAIWNGKTIDTVDTSGYGNGSGWIRYSNGLQICFGAWTDISSEKTVSFNKSFKSGTTPCVSIAQTVGVNMYVNTISHETCKVGASSYNTARSCRYVALGIWK